MARKLVRSIDWDLHSSQDAVSYEVSIGSSMDLSWHLGAVAARIAVRVEAMACLDPKPYKSYKWVVADPRLLGGALAIRGTRLSVALILECMASGMTVSDINESFDATFPAEAVSEVLKVASELASSAHVAA